ncbi:MAG TPA: class I tRNA ligase family protein, partial [Chthoniobacterales bacterium]|nr:class I tRNA ligase family protein [Chthoniobacterales bacterium]
KEDLTLVDRWVLDRLAEIAVTCQAAYGQFEFHKVYHTLNQFCAVDLSSLYIDITKDRMYCDPSGSARRRATQFVMQKTFDALCRWLAPILAFTAEEAWGFLNGTQSVHVQEFPSDLANWRDPESHNRMAEAVALRGIVSQKLEEARQQKLIGNSLEARVQLKLENADSFQYWQENQQQLEEILIVSDLSLSSGSEQDVNVTKTPYQKCARCWRHRESVGKSKTHPDLCDRCEKVVSK